MYLPEMIDLLNEHGVLSSALLARKYKMNFEFAHSVLRAIVDDYENVKHRSADQIYIEGREPQFWKPKPKKKKTIPKKPSKWKDITRP